MKHTHTLYIPAVLVQSWRAPPPSSALCSSGCPEYFASLIAPTCIHIQTETDIHVHAAAHAKGFI